MEPGGAGMENPLKLKRIHHVEFFVGNLRESEALAVIKSCLLRVANKEFNVVNAFQFEREDRSERLL